MSYDLPALLEALLWTNIRVILLITVVALALILIQKQASAYRHNVWLVVIAGCLMLPFISTWMPELQIPVPVDGLFAPNVPQSPIVAFAAAEGVPDNPAAGTVGPAEWIVWLYAFGALAVLAYFGFAFVRLALLEKRMTLWSEPAVVSLLDDLRLEFDVKRRIRLLRDESAKSPFTWGVFSPRIVLPPEAAAWPIRRVRNVLLHELCHIRRFDWLRLMVQRLALSVYWLNPLVWMTVGRCRYEAERACDDFVIESGGNSAEYAEQLVDLIEEGRAAASAAMALGHGNFSGRIRAILNSPTEDHVMSKLRTRFVATVTPISILLLAACQVTSGQPTEAQREAAERAEVQLLEAQRAEEREVLVQAERQAAAQAAEQGAQEARQAAEQAAQQARQAAEQGAQQARQAAEQGAQQARQAAEQGAQEARRAAEQQAREAERFANRRAMDAQRAAEMAEQRAIRAERLESLAALDERTVALRETEVRLAEQELQLRELQMELERRAVQLRELERALAARDRELARTLQSDQPVEPID